MMIFWFATLSGLLLLCIFLFRYEDLHAEVQLWRSKLYHMEERIRHILGAANPLEVLELVGTEAITIKHRLQAIILEATAFSFMTRCEQNWNTAEMDHAIVCLRKALIIRPPGHPNRFVQLVRLASALLNRFQQVGNQDDLDQAHFYYQTALERKPIGHPDRYMVLMNLASTLLIRFEQFGDQGDLDEAIIYSQSAVRLQVPDDTDRSTTLMNLATALLTRYEQVGDWSDLTQAIFYHQSALELRPPGHSNRGMALMNLAGALMARHKQVGDPGDLAQAILHNEEALQLIPPGHPNRPMSLMNLACTLQERYVQVGDQGDLDKAIVYQEEALQLKPTGHPTRSRNLTNLANTLLIRSEMVGTYRDLDKAIIYYQEASELRPNGHPERSLTLILLANALEARFAHINTRELMQDSTSTTGLQNSLDLLQAVSSVTTRGPSETRLWASLMWIEFAVKWGHPSALSAYRTSLELMETVVSTGRSLESRHMRITSTKLWFFDARTIAVDGAACAIDAGQIDVAVELLEQGRSVLLTQAGKYRTSIDELKLVDPDLADEFGSISQLMETSVMSKGGREVDDPDLGGDEIARYQMLLQRWKATIDKIRSVKHFESFLQPTPFDALCIAAAHGPVIIVNISERRSDAIIICAQHNPFVVNLPQATPETLAQMSENANANTVGTNFEGLLKQIWEKLVQPVIHTLQNEINLPKGSRIWWCPTGTASRLPLHAAGVYDKRDQILPNIYISSYTSTLTALIRARQAIHNARPAGPDLLVVGQGNTTGQIALPSVALEVDQFASIAPQATIITGSKGTREEVLNAMRRHNWIHIACHGHLNQARPFQSHFSLQDGPITLLDIAGEKFPNVDLAFLAACHSAEGNIDRPDEVLHLTAGLQFAGVRCVVGTLWAMSDDDGPIIARAFYSRLLGDEGATAGSSAHALHRAIGELRRQKPSIPSSRWACFVHYGP